MTDQNQNDASSDKDANLEQMRKKAERADVLESELTQLRKREAFREAGIGFTDGPGKLVFDTFAGEEITPQAVAEYASSYGVNPAEASAPAPAPSEPTGQQSAEREFFQTTQSASAGAEPSGQAADGVEAAYNAYEGARKEGGRRDKAAAAGLGKMFEAAAAGDSKVVYDQAEWRERNRA